jgi:hypothetical protein
MPQIVIQMIRADVGLVDTDENMDVFKEVMWYATGINRQNTGARARLLCCRSAQILCRASWQA